MPVHPVAARGANHRGGLLVAGVLLAAAALGPVALATRSARPVNQAMATALAQAIQQAGLVCQGTGWAAPAANPSCIGAGFRHAGWFRAINPGEP